MKKRTPIIILVELLGFSCALGIVNIFFQADPGFLNGFFNPYLALALVVAVYYGKYYGIISLAISICIITGPSALALWLIFPSSFSLTYWSTLWTKGLIPFAITLVGTYLFGLIRDSLAKNLQNSKTLIKKFAREKGIMHKELRALKQVNAELEMRVFNQQDSTVALYSKIQALYSLNLQKSLKAIIEIVKSITNATKYSIWEYKQDLKILELRAGEGWEDNEARETRISIDDSIEGWVVRNNILFSVKMVMQYDNLKRMDVGRNIITVPIRAGYKVWGVFNIREMPFEKYNLYTEKNLLLIMALAAPALEKSLKYEALAVNEQVNPITDFPPFSQFYIYLEQELSIEKMEKGTLSVIIIELNNYMELFEKFGKDDIFSFFIHIKERIQELTEGKSRFFHYKSDNQISFLFPNLDYDGCSLYCLDILEMVNKRKWEINKKEVFPEIILGYTSLSDDNQSAQDLLSIADNLLEMQKI